MGTSFLSREPAKSRYLAFIEVGTSFQAGNVGLIDTRYCRYVGLRLAGCFSKAAKAQANAALSAKSTSQDTREGPRMRVSPGRVQLRL